MSAAFLGSTCARAPAVQAPRLTSRNAPTIRFLVASSVAVCGRTSNSRDAGIYRDTLLYVAGLPPTASGASRQCDRGVAMAGRATGVLSGRGRTIERYGIVCFFIFLVGG